MSILDSTPVVHLDRQGLGAKAGLALLAEPGDGKERSFRLRVAGESPGFGGWIVFGLGATGGFCTPDFIITSLLRRFCCFNFYNPG